MSDKYQIELQTGILDIVVTGYQQPLHQLLTFGSRQNPKRRYLFISKVLGKYVPCRPSVMRESYQQLAAEVVGTDLVGKVWVLGVAETATALGAGVAQEVQVNSRHEIIYSHTTRYQLSHTVNFSIKEAHSHAPSHLVYALDSSLQSAEAETVVIVDDEISTGKTLNQLTQKLQQQLPRLKKVVWACLVNWLSPEEQQTFQRHYPDIELAFCDLLNGSFTFKVNEQLAVDLPAKTATAICSLSNLRDSARTGYHVRETARNSFHFVDADQQPLTMSSFDSTQKYTVIGTGEFMHLPFLFAEQMESLGFDVTVQSTGRSPVLEGYGIERKESFFDTAHNGVFYLYNRSQNRHPIMLYETAEQYSSCQLRTRINATAGILS